MPTPTPPTLQDHHIGSLNAPTTIILYGDFECPFTAAAFPHVITLLQEMGEDLLFVYRSFPLYDIHPNALRAAEAGEAAAAQGQFWSMAQTLFGRGKRLDDIALIKYAKDLGLDVDRFKADLESNTYLPKVRELIVEGNQAEVGGTPTFFINGHYFHHKSGLWEMPVLRRALKQALEK